MIPQGLADTSPGELVDRWGVSPELAQKLIAMHGVGLDLMLMIISGKRSCSEQAATGSNLGCCSCTTSDEPCSTHTTSPYATGADLWPTPTPVPAVKARVGAAAVHAGLRWGGGSPVDPATGIPEDWNHVDLGRVVGEVPCR